MRLKLSNTTRHRCPLCREQIERLSNVSCRGCTTLYHQSCWEEFTGCATLGCKSPSFRIELEVRERAPARFLRCAAWPAVSLRRAYGWFLEQLGFQGEVEDKLSLALALGFLAGVPLIAATYLAVEAGWEGVIGVLLAGGLMIGSHAAAHWLLRKLTPPRD